MNASDCVAFFFASVNGVASSSAQNEAHAQDGWGSTSRPETPCGSSAKPWWVEGTKPPETPGFRRFKHS